MKLEIFAKDTEIQLLRSNYQNHLSEFENFQSKYSRLEAKFEQIKISIL